LPLTHLLPPPLQLLHPLPLLLLLLNLSQNMAKRSIRNPRNLLHLLLTLLSLSNSKQFTLKRAGLSLPVFV
jgi:hypothetical protein